MRVVDRSFRHFIAARVRPLAAAALFAFVAGAAAQSSAPPELGRDIRGVLEFLEARNPELRAMVLEADAARQRSGVSDALPDPMFTMELRDVPISDPTLSPANAGNTRYALRQTFPLGDKRELRRGIADADVAAADARRGATLAELRMKAKTAYSQYWYATQAHRVTDGVRSLMTDLEQIARARYGNGLVPQQDVIKAQTQISILDLQRDRRHLLPEVGVIGVLLDHLGQLQTLGNAGAEIIIEETETGEAGARSREPQAR